MAEVNKAAADPVETQTGEVSESTGVPEVTTTTEETVATVENEAAEIELKEGPKPLQFGDEGEEVTELQKSLVNWGVFGKDNVNGRFDVYTQDALKHFQSGQNLPQTGVVDEITQIALDGKLDPATEPETVSK